MTDAWSTTPRRRQRKHKRIESQIEDESFHSGGRIEREINFFLVVEWFYERNGGSYGVDNYFSFN